MKEDDEVDNLEIKLDAGRKSKRVYKSPSPEVIMKISQSLKVIFFIIVFKPNFLQLFSNTIKIGKLSKTPF